MSISTTLKLLALVSVIVCAGGVRADEWSKIVFPGYQEGVMAGGLGINDYVQDGLVAWYDGTYNVATDQPHSATAERWANLGSGGSNYDMTFSNTTGEWKEDGYYFNGGSYAVMANELDLIDGTNFTVEAAVEIDSTKQNASSVSGGITTYLVARQDATKWGGGSHAGFYTRIASSSHKEIQWEEGTLSSVSGLPVTMNPWRGKYLLGVVTNCYRCISQVARNLFDGVEVPAVAAGKVRTVTKWALGGCPGEKRYSFGLYRALRFYNRTLSSAELQRNRQVDDWRFYGLGNVLVRMDVASSEEGVEYCVNGEATFEPPESITVEHGAYVPAGYTLEVWNVTDNVWEMAEVSSANSFTYTNCLARARVRLTWRTKATGRIRSLTHPDVDDYISNGLLAQYDGLRNVSRTSGHDNSAVTSWANIGINGSDQDLTFSNQNGEWYDDGYKFNGSSSDKITTGNSYAAMKNAIALGDGKNFTAELVLSDVLEKISKTRHFLAKEDAGNGNAGIYVGGSKTTLQWEDKDLNYEESTYKIDNWNRKYVAAIVTNGYRCLCDDAINPITKESSFIGSQAGVMSLKRWSIGGGIPNNLNYFVSNVYHAVRFYNRVLSTEELQWNRAVDELRFRGEEAILSAVTNVIVASKLSGDLALSDQQDGAYVVDGTWVFTPCAATNANGKEVMASGYTLETLDADGNVTQKSSASETSYAYTATDTAPTIRLTWRYSTSGFAIIVR